MILWQLLTNNPLAGVALVLTLATLVWCTRLLRMQHSRIDRYLMALLGFIAMYQGISILKNTGLWHYPAGGMVGALDVLVAAVCLVSALILRIVTADRHNTKVALRVVEANQPAPRPVKPLPLLTERSVLAVFGVDGNGAINMWHNTSEQFFGWRRDEVIGTQLPFKQRPVLDETDAEQQMLPRVMQIRTKLEDEMKALVWAMPVPGEKSHLILVLDCEESRHLEVVEASTGNHRIPRAQFSPGV